MVAKLEPSALNLETRYFPLAVAVSGGADSMALLLLAHEWATTHHTSVSALTVDHGLRPESAQEAKCVAQWCRELGIAHCVLNVQDSGLRIQAKQDAARAARYQLLSEWCKTNHHPALATAHHRGDQAETLFFRLGRGSGIMGLSSIAPVSQVKDIILLRPLLGYRKSDLQAFLASREQAWLEDPSNQNPKYTRNLLRARLQSAPGAEHIEARAASLAESFARIRAVIERMVEQAFRDCTRRDACGLLTLDHGRFMKLESETARLLLARILADASGHDHPPRTHKLERLQVALSAREFTRASLGGFCFYKNPGSNEIKITREDLKKSGKVPYSSPLSLIRESGA